MAIADNKPSRTAFFCQMCCHMITHNVIFEWEPQNPLVHYHSPHKGWQGAPDAQAALPSPPAVAGTACSHSQTSVHGHEVGHGRAQWWCQVLSKHNIPQKKTSRYEAHWVIMNLDGTYFESSARYSMLSILCGDMWWPHYETSHCISEVWNVTTTGRMKQWRYSYGLPYS